MLTGTIASESVNNAGTDTDHAARRGWRRVEAVADRGRSFDDVRFEATTFRLLIPVLFRSWWSIELQLRPKKTVSPGQNAHATLGPISVARGGRATVPAPFGSLSTSRFGTGFLLNDGRFLADQSVKPPPGRKTRTIHIT